MIYDLCQLLVRFWRYVTKFEKVAILYSSSVKHCTLKVDSVVIMCTCTCNSLCILHCIVLSLVCSTVLLNYLQRVCFSACILQHSMVGNLSEKYYTVGINKKFTKIWFSSVAVRCWYCQGLVKCGVFSAAVCSKCGSVRCGMLQCGKLHLHNCASALLTVPEIPTSGNSAVRCGVVHCGTVTVRYCLVQCINFLLTPNIHVSKAKIRKKTKPKTKIKWKNNDSSDKME